MVLPFACRAEVVTSPKKLSTLPPRVKAGEPNEVTYQPTGWCIC